MKKKLVPQEGIQGLIQNWKADMLSGFMVFLLALPLSLGIAGASDFPPIYGLITAMVGGLVVSFFAGSALTIKGPAAGLIVIVAGSVAELGRGDNVLGWKLALGAIVIAGFFQILFGILKFGSFSDFFPVAAVHGMLAAIGIIIISKQAHVLLGMNPLNDEGKPMVEPIELLCELRHTIPHFLDHSLVFVIGVISLFIVFAWPKIAGKRMRKIPAALVVLIISIPLAKFLDLHNTNDIKDAAGAIIQKGYAPMLTFDQNLSDILGVKVDFSGLKFPGIFWKYVLMFALVGSLEALLTVKAIDMQDPFKRRSNPDKDLISVGIGNMVAGIMGGLPMISEVARSSANVTNGAKTGWSNFFHGLFILLFLTVEVSFNDLIPKAALAALLIGVGWKLAHPREFGLMIRTGKDQAFIFIVTIIATLLTDLLVGISLGILTKFILHFFRGVPLRIMFKPKMTIQNNVIIVEEAAVFSNFIPVKKKLLAFKQSDEVMIDFSKCFFIDHSVVETLYHIKDDFMEEGGELIVLGIEELKPVGNSKHHLSALRKRK
jgi:MFS superfamily sulfate permease-like transporter